MFSNLEAKQKQYGYTNADMAELLGVSRITYENKKRTGMFNRPQIEALLRLFYCKFEHLFQFDEDEVVIQQPCESTETCITNRPI